MSFLNPSRSPIGLDLGSRTVKAVQLARKASRWQISAATTFPRALPDTPVTPGEARRLIDVLYRQNFQGRDVVLAVPPLRLLDGTLELPKASDAPLDQIALMEFSRLQKCDPQAIEIGYWNLPVGLRSQQSSRVMAMGCLHRDIEPMIDAFESEGLDVVGLDAEACALARACAPNLVDANSLCGLLDFGWGCCRLIVLYQGAIVYTRLLTDSGISALFTSLQKNLDIDAEMAEHLLIESGMNQQFFGQADLIADARRSLAAHFDAIVQELNISFSYATQQYSEASLQRVLITGGGARISGVAGHLANLIGTDVVTLAPRDVLGCPPTLLERCGNPALTLATGLARFSDE